MGNKSEDIIEKLLMNILNGGRIEEMKKKIMKEEGDIMVLRKIEYDEEDDMEKLEKEMKFKIIK